MSKLTGEAIISALNDYVDPKYDYEPGFDELADELTKNIPTDIGTFSFIEYGINGGYEQDAYAIVRHVESGRAFKFTAYYTSYDGAQWDDGKSFEVIPKEVVRTEWVKK